MGEAIVGLIALTAMEIVLGIDNIVFITIVTDKLPPHQREFGARLGLGLAMVARIVLLFSLTWVLGLTEPVFTLEQLGISKEWVVPQDVTDPNQVQQWEHFWEEFNLVSWRDLILLGGGLFLVAKSVLEIHHEIEGSHGSKHGSEQVSLGSVLFQIAILDIIFSLDSVITAVGMVSRDKIWVMVTAIIISIGVMVAFAAKIGAFVSRHPTIKMLALSFLILIGVMLIAEGIGTHIDKRYIYFAMVFALLVEALNMRQRNRRLARDAHDSGRLAAEGS